MYLPLNKTCLLVGFSSSPAPKHNRFKNEGPGISTNTSMFSQEIEIASLVSSPAVLLPGRLAQISLPSELFENPLSTEAQGPT